MRRRFASSRLCMLRLPSTRSSGGKQSWDSPMATSLRLGDCGRTSSPVTSKLPTQRGNGGRVNWLLGRSGLMTSPWRRPRRCRWPPTPRALAAMEHPAGRARATATGAIGLGRSAGGASASAARAASAGSGGTRTLGRGGATVANRTAVGSAGSAAATPAGGRGATVGGIPVTVGRVDGAASVAALASHR